MRTIRVFHLHVAILIGRLFCFALDLCVLKLALLRERLCLFIGGVFAVILHRLGNRTTALLSLVLYRDNVRLTAILGFLLRAFLHRCRSLF